MSPEPSPKSTGDTPAYIVFAVLAILLAIGLAIETPGVLIILLILIAPALVRTFLFKQSSPDAESPPTFMMFLSSLGLMVIVGLAASAAFFATCFVICAGIASTNVNNYGSIFYPSVGAGIVLGLFVAYQLLRRLWDRKANGEQS